MFYLNTLPEVGPQPHTRMVILCTDFEFARRWAEDLLQLGRPSYMKVYIFTTVEGLRGLNLSGITCLSLRMGEPEEITPMEEIAMIMRAASVWNVNDGPTRYIRQRNFKDYEYTQCRVDGRSAPIPGVPGGRKPRG